MAMRQAASTKMWLIGRYCRKMSLGIASHVLVGNFQIHIPIAGSDVVPAGTEVIADRAIDDLVRFREGSKKVRELQTLVK